MPYTEAQLAVYLSVVCPKCHAAIGSKCLDPMNWGSQFIGTPHPERVIKSGEGSEKGEII
jgi:hypothetical protein